MVGTSEAGSAPTKSLDVTCPAGLRMTGAGADLNGGFGHVVLERMLLPDAGSEDLNLLATGGPVDGQAGSWFVRGYPICGTPPPGLERLEAFSDQQTFASLPVSCPAGKRLLGGAGGLAIAGHGGLVVDGLVPRSDLTGMTMTVGANGPSGDVLWATPLCANPPPGLQLVSATSAPPDDEIEFATVTVSCPAAKHLLGTGARINGGNNQVVLDDLRPDASLKKVTVSGYEDSDGYDQDWTLTAFGICVSS